ncbi:MAG: class I SAM-dependent methyltransferase [Acidobacteria bacterium]|nr:MAG: class I SAM-dependent methyltransferase [Acidobacteriota bacterium]
MAKIESTADQEAKVVFRPMSVDKNIIIGISNHDTYEREHVVRAYERDSELQKPEEVVLTMLKDRLKDMRMLDIGVGAGRTTFLFAPLVKEYIGIDYSHKMIEACKRRFSERADSFRVCDARSMSTLPDDYFDFVLFSFNGIDYVPVTDRKTILMEVARVARAGAQFLFSTHNLNMDIERAFSISWTTNPKENAKQMYRRVLFRLRNRNWRHERANATHMIIDDGALGLLTSYIEPEEQVRQLEGMGFTDVKVFSMQGRQLEPADLAHAKDPWLHYLCGISKTVSTEPGKELRQAHAAYKAGRS